jgi:hypothetical protein
MLPGLPKTIVPASFSKIRRTVLGLAPPKCSNLLDRIVLFDSLVRGHSIWGSRPVKKQERN